MNFSAENLAKWDDFILLAEARVKRMKESIRHFKVMREEGWDFPFESLSDWFKAEDGDPAE